jgi:hypothetical protein
MIKRLNLVIARPVYLLAAAAAATLGVVAAVMGGTQSVSGGPNASMEMNPGVQRVAVGQSPFSVAVEVDNLAHEICFGAPGNCAPSVGLAGFQVDLSYNDDVVDIRGAVAGPDLGKTGRQFTCQTQDDEERDRFSFGCYSAGQAEGLQGSAVLARIEIAPIGAGSTAVEVEGELSGPYSEDIPVDVKGAFVIVENGPGGSNGNPSSQNSSTPGGTQANGTDEPGTQGESDTLIDEDGTPISAQDAAATATAQAGGESAVANPDEEPGDDDDNGDGAQSSDSSGDDGGGDSFATVLLVSLGVIAGVGALAAGGFTAWRVRNGG